MAISKIIADSITDEAVTSAKIAQGTVVAADVADGTITNAKIDTVANTKITGVITNAQLANTTGSGAVVLTTSPTLVTPALGTPSALVGTNISGTAAGLTAGNVTTNANLTGQVTSVGNAAVLGSFTSAQLATALSDETGSGLAVFGTSPNLITPILGTPTSGNLTNCTGLPALGHSRVSLTSGNITTTSTSLADLTGATVTFTTGANPIHVSFAATWAQSTTGQTAYFNILVDGAAQFGTNGLMYDATAAGYGLSVSCAFDTAALSSGSHTIKVQWKVSAGTGTIYANSTNAAILSAHEIL